MLRPAIAIDFFIFILQLNGNIEVDDFRTEFSVDNDVVRFDISVGDAKSVKVSQTFNEAQANLSDMWTEFAQRNIKVIRDR
jgi:hypothetical protein